MEVLNILVHLIIILLTGAVILAAVMLGLSLIYHPHRKSKIKPEPSKTDKHE